MSAAPSLHAAPMIEPDIILPSHLLRRTHATPEKRLLLAVLEEAVGTYQRYILATDPRGMATLAEVETWFASEDTARLYAFVAICDALGIDAPYVRSGLAGWGHRHRTPSLEMGQPLSTDSLFAG